MSNKQLHMMDLSKSISSQKQLDYLKQLFAEPKKPQIIHTGYDYTVIKHRNTKSCNQ